MKVLICGSRRWTDREAIQKVIDGLDPGTTVIHGAATGADSIAGELAGACGLGVLAFPAGWDEHGECHCPPTLPYCRAAGPRRNRQMLEEGKPDRVVAFPLSGSKGTADMIRQARGRGIPVEVLP